MKQTYPITNLTYKGKDSPEKDIYWFDLTQADDDALTAKHAKFSKPYSIDIAPAEDAILIAITSKEGSQRIVTLPIADWKDRIIERARIVKESETLLIDAQNLDAQNMGAYENHEVKRRAHHNESAELLQKAFASEGLDLSFEAARNLFACMATYTQALCQKASKDGAQRLFG